MWLFWIVEGVVDVASLEREVGVDVASMESRGRDRCGFSGEWKAGWMWLLWRVEGGIDVASLESGGRDGCGFCGEWRAGWT